jgi:hypothetical protein
MRLDYRTYINEPYFCKACLFLFSVHTKLRKDKMPNCPNCGDRMEVIRYHTKIVHQIKEWTSEELALIDQLIEGKLFHYQVAALTGRTIPSIDSKMRRVKRAREREGKS